MSEKSERKFEGLLTYRDIKEELKKKYPDISEEEMAVRIRVESNFQKRHLRAYLRGQKKFSWGRDVKKMPIWYEVKDGEEKS